MPNEKFVNEYREIRLLAGKSGASVVQSTLAEAVRLVPEKDLHPYWLRPLSDTRKEPPQDELLVWIIPKTLLGEHWVDQAVKKMNDIRSYPSSYGLENTPTGHTADMESFNRIIRTVFTGEIRNTSFLDVVDLLQESYSHGV